MSNQAKRLSDCPADRLAQCRGGDLPPAGDGVDFGIDGRSVRVSQEAYSIFLAREQMGKDRVAALQQRLNIADQRVCDLQSELTKTRSGFSNLRDVARDCEHLASSYCGSIDGVEEHGGDDHEDPTCAIWHRLYYAMFDADKALAHQPAPAPSEEDWHMNPCKQGHGDVGACCGKAFCHACDETITAATTQEAFERWNSTHAPAEKREEPLCLLCLDEKTVPGPNAGDFVRDCPDCCGEEG